MRFSATYNGNRGAMAGLNIPVSTIAALGAGVLAGIALDGDHQLRFRLDAPHRIYKVTSVLSS